MLNKPSSFSFGLARISLTFVGLMWVLPFLYYNHAYPITTFYQEWGAGLLGLCAMPLLLTSRYWQAPEVPRIVMLPIGLMLLLMVQFLAGRISYFDHLMLLALYFMFAALLIMLGQRLRVELGLPALATALAVFLLAGAELNTLAGILQHYRWNTFLNPVITAKTSHAVYGNLAQPNHYANYIALGMISLGLLYARFSMRIWQVALLAVPMLFVMVLSGSRSSWLYLLSAAGLAFLWQRRDQTLRPLLYFTLALLLAFGLMHFVVQIPWLEGATGSVTTTERLFGDNASGAIRLHLWREAVLIFLQFPLLGAGFGQFAFQHFQLAAELHNTALTGLYNNAHDLVMQTAAEAGLSGVLILLGTLGMWFRQSVRGAQYTIYHWWGYAILAVLGIHSLLEYPLWYLYFMGVAAIMLGIFDTTTYRLELRNVGRASAAAMLVLGALSLTQMFLGYKRLENALVMKGKTSADRSLVPRVQDELMAVHQSPLLGSYADLFIASTMELSADHLEQKLELNERAQRFIPIAPVVYHQVSLLALSDREAEAKAQLERAIWSYPMDYPTARTELEELARKDPARFSALLEFATQKYEEYQRAAIPAK
ncbi:O-antigen ligase family protein [Sideroxydans sp. CL21]|uniref:PglL family O-oligosaccharyltransferase n=1 Tax=Sideroxydans sp. CL21 TaxID=2600596 RepID=UPI0024BCB3B4|nr:O-antigen ligase family protein [Sideroxydans sp. CL21]